MILNTDLHTDGVQFIEVYGLRRTGNHAIISWLIHNLDDTYEELETLVSPYPEWGFLSQRKGHVYHINDAYEPWCITNPAYVRGFIDAYAAQGAKYIIISYEDQPTTTSLYELYKEYYPMLQGAQKIALTRDIKSLLASRVRRTGGQNLASGSFHISEELLKTYKALAAHHSVINFESWLTDPEYRTERSTTLFNKPNIDVTNHVSQAGKGSSFLKPGELPDPKDLLKRAEQQALPADVLQLLEAQGLG